MRHNNRIVTSGEEGGVPFFLFVGRLTLELKLDRHSVIRAPRFVDDHMRVALLIPRSLHLNSGLDIRPHPPGARTIKDSLPVKVEGEPLLKSLLQSHRP